MNGPDSTQQPVANPDATGAAAHGATLLALDAGVRETGWAIYREGSVDATGVIRLPRSRSLDATYRVEHLVRCLENLIARCQPEEVAYGQPSGIRWPVPALELLDSALIGWSARHRLPLYTYSAQEVRAAIARHSHVPQDQLAFAIMVRLGMIGASKSTPEWEALAVGYYHLLSRR